MSSESRRIRQEAQLKPKFVNENLMMIVVKMGILFTLEVEMELKSLLKMKEDGYP